MAFTVNKIVPSDANITINDLGASFEIVYDMANRNVNSVILYLKWTKDVATEISFVAEYRDINDGIEYFKETKINTSSEIVPDNRILKAGGNYRIIYNVSKCEENVKIVVTPDSVAGNDILDIAIAEDALGQ